MCTQEKKNIISAAINEAVIEAPIHCGEKEIPSRKTTVSQQLCQMGHEYIEKHNKSAALQWSFGTNLLIHTSFS